MLVCLSQEGTYYREPLSLEDSRRVRPVPSGGAGRRCNAFAFRQQGSWLQELNGLRHLIQESMGMEGCRKLPESMRTAGAAAGGAAGTTAGQAAAAAGTKATGWALNCP